MPNRDKKCCMEYCPQPVFAKGYCRTHYGRKWRTGNPLLGDPRKPKRPEGQLNQKIMSAELEMEHAKEVYAIAYGPARVRWAETIRDLKEEIANLRKNGVKTFRRRSKSQVKAS